MWPSPPQQWCDKIVEVGKVDSLSEEEKRVINEFASRVRRIFGKRLKKLLLFGSRARGKIPAARAAACVRKRAGLGW